MPNPTLGGFSAALGLVSSIFIATFSAWLAFEYIGEVGSRCGTHQYTMLGYLSVVVPALLCIPAAAYYVCRRAKYGDYIARIALLAAVTAWLTCFAIIP